ncbi:hypothetical protein Tco_1530765 [Tanacetum coccineum]
MSWGRWSSWLVREIGGCVLVEESQGRRFGRMLVEEKSGEVRTRKERKGVRGLIVDGSEVLGYAQRMMSREPKSLGEGEEKEKESCGIEDYVEGKRIESGRFEAMSVRAERSCPVWRERRGVGWGAGCKWVVRGGADCGIRVVVRIMCVSRDDVSVEYRILVMGMGVGRVGEVAEANRESFLDAVEVVDKADAIDSWGWVAARGGYYDAMMWVWVTRSEELCAERRRQRGWYGLWSIAMGLGRERERSERVGDFSRGRKWYAGWSRVEGLLGPVAKGGETWSLGRPRGDASRSGGGFDRWFAEVVNQVDVVTSRVAWWPKELRGVTSLCMSGSDERSGRKGAAYSEKRVPLVGAGEREMFLGWREDKKERRVVWRSKGSRSEKRTRNLSRIVSRDSSFGGISEEGGIMYVDPCVRGTVWCKSGQHVRVGSSGVGSMGVVEEKYPRVGLGGVQGKECALAQVEGERQVEVWENGRIRSCRVRSHMRWGDVGEIGVDSQKFLCGEFGDGDYDGLFAKGGLAFNEEGRTLVAIGARVCGVISCRLWGRPGGSLMAVIQRNGGEERFRRGMMVARSADGLGRGLWRGVEIGFWWERLGRQGAGGGRVVRVGELWSALEISAVVGVMRFDVAFIGGLNGEELLFLRAAEFVRRTSDVVLLRRSDLKRAERYVLALPQEVEHSYGCGIERC